MEKFDARKLPGPLHSNGMAPEVGVTKVVHSHGLMHMRCIPLKNLAYSRLLRGRDEPGTL